MSVISTIRSYHLVFVGNQEELLEFVLFWWVRLDLAYQFNSYFETGMSQKLGLLEVGNLTVQ